jgi:hypothetical protein
MSDVAKLYGGFACAGISAACFAVIATAPSIPVSSAAFAGAVFFGMVSAACFTSIKSN